MRGADTFTESLFMMRKLEDFIPQDHPLREVRKMANAALEKMAGLFAGMYESESKGGRPSIAPEKLLRAMLLQVLYSVRSERQLMEQVQYNLLFRWFVGLGLNQKVWSFTALSRDIATLLNEPRAVLLIQKIIGEVFCGALLQMPEFSLNFALLHTWLGKHACATTISN